MGDLAFGEAIRLTHPDRRRYGGLDLAAPSKEDMGPARFEANLGVAAEHTADSSVDFPADPTGPAAAGYHRKERP